MRLCMDMLVSCHVVSVCYVLCVVSVNPARVHAALSSMSESDAMRTGAEDGGETDDMCEREEHGRLQHDMTTCVSTSGGS